LGAIAVIAVMAACGNDGPKTLSADAFVDKVNGICRTATRTVEDLDVESDTYFSDVDDALQQAVDGLTPIKAPKELATDFEDLLTNFDDQSTQLGKLAKAAKAGDSEGLATAGDKLTGLAADSDDLTDSLGVRSCFGADSVEVAHSLSKDELIAQMNAICAKADEDLSNLSVTDVGTYFDQAADLFQGVADDLGTLAPPASLAGDYADYLTSLGTVSNTLRTLGSSGSFDTDALSAATDANSALAGSIGADSCVALVGSDDTLGS
jgi:hypothetical protein